LAERDKEYLEAAESINCSKLSIMFSHLLPNIIQPTIVGMTTGFGGTIINASGLSYLGLGVQPPTPEWGALLSEGTAVVRTYPYIILFPGLIIGITVLAVNLMGDGIRDALDPKLRQ
jgi:ABC-type dipeptide/oligopeptide/nickel transport system permease subunit